MRNKRFGSLSLVHFVLLDFVYMKTSIFKKNKITTTTTTIIIIIIITRICKDLNIDKIDMVNKGVFLVRFNCKKLKNKLEYEWNIVR